MKLGIGGGAPSPVASYRARRSGSVSVSYASRRSRRRSPGWRSDDWTRTWRQYASRISSEVAVGATPRVA